jgi:exodeoxyribonuclease V alpha subunit
VDQLPSVGPGNVLRDIIESNAFRVITLTNVFRQDEAGDIVLNAHRIHRGETVVLDNKSKDFFFLKRYDSDHILKVVMLLVQEKLPKYVNASPYDIQILTPTRKGLLGVENLNPILQKYLNPPDDHKAEHSFGTMLIREGDKVMQTKNDYQMEWQILGKYGITIEKGTGIFNGDIGIVEEVNDFNSTLRIRFDDGHMVDYPYKQIDQLELAYAMTIHKSQGSEYPAVVMPLLSGPRMLYNRNLLYTAVTRAKNCVVIVGDENVFYKMEQNNQQQRRYSGLEDRLREQSMLLEA